MDKLYFATGNDEKMLIAQVVCKKFNINVERVYIDIDEIQGEDPLIIVKDKVRRAYESLLKPVVVSDDSWSIPALKGFPGPYMKSINKWFEPYDFIRLMRGIKDRRVILYQFLAYYDGKNMQIFKNKINGKIIDKPRGMNARSPNATVTVLDYDNGKTIAEVFMKGKKAVLDRYKNRRDVWHEFADWYSIKSK